jgi:hypothetical protein
MNEAAPIVLIVFNRPEHTYRILEALKANSLAGESILYIFSDAARGREDETKVNEVRAIIRQASGFKKIILNESDRNMGCSPSVLTAVSTVLALHGQCIVVEDDVLVSPLFLQYMNEALAFYKEDKTIFCIGAYCPPFRMPEHYPEDIFLLNRFCSWGWATWKSAWDKISVEPSLILNDLANAANRKAFAESGADLLRTFSRDPDIWDLRVTYGLWKQGLRTVFPVVSLTANIGRDGSGVHYDGQAKNESDSLNFPSNVPKLKRLEQVDENISTALQKWARKPLGRVIFIKLAKTFGIYGFLLRIFGK